MTHPTPPHPCMTHSTPTPPMYDPLHPIGFQKFMSGYKGMCVSERKFLKLWQVTDKIIEWIFHAIHIQHFMSDSNSKKITRKVSKIHEWFWGDLYEWGKVS